MNIFLDTNVFVEFVDNRADYGDVCQLMDSILIGEHRAHISQGCLYTLTFLFERYLEKQDIH